MILAASRDLILTDRSPPSHVAWARKSCASLPADGTPAQPAGRQAFSKKIYQINSNNRFSCKTFSSIQIMQTYLNI